MINEHGRTRDRQNERKFLRGQVYCAIVNAVEVADTRVRRSNFAPFALSRAVQK